MTAPTPPCPACGAALTARGRLNDGRPGTFTPAGLRFWTLTVGMVPLEDRSTPGAPPLNPAAHACTSCGLVWTHVDPERLRTVLRESGDAETRARFDGEARDGASEPPR